MNKKLLAGGLFIIAFAVYGIFAFKENVNPYTNFKGAETAWGAVQIKGVWDQSKESSYSVEDHTFTFWLKDETGEIRQVLFHGSKPNNFEHATSIVVKGNFENQVFTSDRILVKCPSKYQSEQADGIKFQS